MPNILQILSILFTVIILQKIVVVVHSLNSKSWTGQKFRFFLLTLSLALIVGGAAGVVFGYHWGGYSLLYGIGGRFAFDRRLIEVNRTKLIKES
jgi:hypothetical protein